jgi:hypothetical protein
MNALIWVWAAATTVLVGLLIYRALLSMKEDDQLFLGDGERHLARAQEQIVGKVRAVGRYSLIMGIVSAVLLLAIAGMWTYQQLNRAA